MRVPILKPFMAPDAIHAIEQVLYSGWLASGPNVEQFELEISAQVGGRPVLAVNSGTSALMLAFELAGIQRGDEVITSSLTCLATNIPLLHRGAIPVWADITANGVLDPDDVAVRITDRTRAIVAVDFGGFPSDYRRLSEIAASAGIRLIIDAAHSLGAARLGDPFGGSADYICLSFQATKTVSCGDGGALAPLNVGDFDRAYPLRWYGIDRRRRTEGDVGVARAGYKMEMNDIAACIGLANIPYLGEQVARRRSQAATYRSLLRRVPGITLLPDVQAVSPSNWLFPILVEDRVGFRARLAAAGIESSPVHYRNDRCVLFAEYRALAVPVLERWGREMTCLPIGHWVSDDDIAAIAALATAGW